MTVAVDDPGACNELMAQVFGSICLTETDARMVVPTGEGAAPLFVMLWYDLDTVHPEMEPLATAGEPVLAALSLTVRDPAVTAVWLDDDDAPFRRDSGGTDRRRARAQPRCDARVRRARQGGLVASAVDTDRPAFKVLRPGGRHRLGGARWGGANGLDAVLVPTLGAPAAWAQEGETADISGLRPRHDAASKA